MLVDMNNSVAVRFYASDEDRSEATLPLILTASLAVVLCLLIVSCIVGNVMVLLAICWERDLRGRPQYYLIFSLAVADLIVGVIVTPLGAWSTLVGGWNMGVALCDFWISVDVLVCTASILHLVAIALDRYWSITEISYVQNRTPRRIILMLAGVWMLSLLISLAPFAGWKDDGFNDRVRNQHTCLISQQISYQVFSTATAFYIPLIAIVCVYWKIMTAAKKRFKRERDRRTVIRPPPDEEKKVPLIAKNKEKKVPLPPAVIICDVDGTDNKDGKIKRENSSSTTSEEERTATAETRLDGSTPTKTQTKQTGNGMAIVNGTSLISKKKRRPKESAENRRERKAWRTLAIITGTFIACWTPFFIVSLYRPLCQCQIPPAVELITAWLGYLNSALNPVIYTIFSQDMRNAFKRIIKRVCFVSL